jgi:hypothetical protein
MKKQPAVSARNKQENKSDVEAHLFCPFDLLFELRSLHFSFLLLHARALLGACTKNERDG